MVNLHPALPATPLAMPARAPAPVETVQAVRPADTTPRSRGGGLGTPDGWERADAARKSRPDPEALVGPPPAFQANVLEAERARLSDPRPPAEEPRREGPGRSSPDGCGADSGAGCAEPAALPAYREARFGGGPPRVDVMR